MIYDLKNFEDNFLVFLYLRFNNICQLSFQSLHNFIHKLARINANLWYNFQHKTPIKNINENFKNNYHRKLLPLYVDISRDVNVSYSYYIEVVVIEW